jgi:trimeric autotransporter adhesin
MTPEEVQMSSLRSSRPLLLILFALFILIGGLLHQASAQPAAQVADINTVRTGGTDVWFWRTSFYAVGGTILFQVDDGKHGMELWRTDGTAAGTALVMDICPGACSSLPQLMTVVGGELFFIATDGVHGTELWKSDGTAAGTRMVADLAPGQDNGNPVNLRAFGGKLFFVPQNAGAGSGEIWTSDGTTASLLADIEPGSGRSDPAFLGQVGAFLLFSAKTSATGRELWRTDGTAAGTSLVTDIHSGTADGVLRSDQGHVRALSAVSSGGRVFFTADDGTHGEELWVSDGTAAGTRMVKDVNPSPGGSSQLFFFVPFGAGVMFRADDGTHGSEIWVSDGTEAGTSLVQDINTSSPGSGSGPWDLVAAGSHVFFHANDGIHGVELWVTDGSSAGTSMVADIRPDTGTGVPFSLPPEAVVGSDFLFYADDGVHGAELWKTDGTPAGTSMLADIDPGAGSSFYMNGGSDGQISFVQGGRWLFSAYTASDSLEVWTSDGTAAGTHKLTEINDQASAFPILFLGTLQGPRTFADLGGSLLFQADDGVTGGELWKSDGSAAGTAQIADIAPGSSFSWSFPNDFTPLNGALLFSADDGVHGSELWKTDGTPAGTAMLKDLDPSLSYSNGSPHWLTPLGTKIFFAGPGDGAWTSDGTNGGTQPLNAPVTVSGPPAALGGALLFRGNASGTGEELWRTDGTLAGTALVKDIRAGTGSGSPYLLTAAGGIGGMAFFSAATDAAGRELWKTDGTAGGTTLVKDIQPGAGDGIVATYDNDDVDLGQEWAALGGKVIFAANDGASGLEPWVSDGTAAGTIPLGDLLPGALGSEPLWATTAAGRVFFVADDGGVSGHGRELWTTDGTPAGTSLLIDIEPGAGSSLPNELKAVGRVLLFSAWDAAHGRELWVSDGTVAGTARVQDIAPGMLSASPLGFTLSGSRIHFAANDNTHGFELWTLPRTALGAALAATKTVTGSFYEGGTVTYRIVVTSSGRTLQPDAAGAELTDVLPSGIALTGGTATSGTLTTSTSLPRTITWNGSLAAGASVTITLTATLQAGTLGTTINNQATLAWDADADGVNEAAGVSDNPGAPGSADTTPILVGPEIYSFYTVTPCRAVDTRTTTALASGALRTFPIAGTCGIPATARAVALNVTVLDATGAGYLVLWRSGLTMPGTSNINFTTAKTRGNNAIVALSGGALDTWAAVGGNGSVQMLIDVSGYFQ